MLTYFKDKKVLAEQLYDMKDDAKHAALLTTGNGYFGVRGSLEEFGALNIQGTYIRGLLDRVIEIPSIYVDNIYMKKYYIDELKAKAFEYQDASINIADFLLIRFKVGDKIFYPWEGIIKSWVRYIDPSDGSLNRHVTWDDGKGNISILNFKRYASFSHNHHYFLEASIEKINHDLDIEIQSGVDTWTKTNGQKKSKLESKKEFDHFTQYHFTTGDLYHFEVCMSIHHDFKGVDLNSKTSFYENGMYLESYKSNKKITKVFKSVYVNATMDLKENQSLEVENIKGMDEILEKSYDTHYKNHLKAFRKRNDMIHIDISDDEDQALVNFSNYHTLIAIDRYTDIHSVTAKNLTGEKYNQFIWWDAEIYQFPIYLMTMPDAARNILMYRYHRLKQSKNNALNDGLDGAKFAFCSSVLGDEKVWSYARHPFLQIHINSDIAYAILNYVKTTHDFEFLDKYGIEMLYEISKYFISRVQYNHSEGSYELNQVTGTDEHHPYVNNNSYTNYVVRYILNKTYELIYHNQNYYNKLNVEKRKLDLIFDVSQKIKCSVTKDGYIPQFDGYFNLRDELEVTGNGAAKNFQMKASGLYHESQIIKQPDVLMLFTYVDLPNLQGDYKKNWVYYENKCEASSSLTYPVHAICAIDHLEYDKFYDYWYKSCAIDNIDYHHEAHLGLHGACMAGGWYSIFKGLFGIKIYDDYIEFNPKSFDKWQHVSINFMYQDHKVKASINGYDVKIESSHGVNIKYKNNIFENRNILEIKI